MTAGGQTRADASRLELAVDSGNLPVSSLSSLLRVLQATLREVARGDDDTREVFSQQSQPVLHLFTRIAEGELVMGFAFVGPLDAEAMSEVSERVFGRFLGRLSQLIKTLPQRGLWGDLVAGGRQQRHESGVEQRLDHLRMELRRFPRATLRFQSQAILFEGDRMEIA